MPNRRSNAIDPLSITFIRVATRCVYLAVILQPDQYHPIRRAAQRILHLSSTAQACTWLRHKLGRTHIALMAIDSEHGAVAFGGDRGIRIVSGYVSDANHQGGGL